MNVMKHLDREGLAGIGRCDVKHIFLAITVYSNSIEVFVTMLTSFMQPLLLLKVRNIE